MAQDCLICNPGRRQPAGESQSVGCVRLTTPSAVIVPGPKVMTWDEWVTQKTVVVRRARRKEVVPEGQMGFGI
jgi:hypothetical protein